VTTSQQTPDLKTDPFGFFEYMRKTEPVWRGTIMDTSMAPRELSSAEEWTLFDFESVFAAFRDDDVYGSEMYNNTIGLVFGPTILGMHGKQHHDHRSLVAKAFRQSALEHWEPELIDPI
jgi:cytochrome P450